jgi:glucitol operon activator protein
MWQWGLLALGVLWALQSLGVWYQMRHYGDVMKGITSKYNDGYAA